MTAYAQNQDILKILKLVNGLKSPFYYVDAFLILIVQSFKIISLILSRPNQVG